MTGMCCYDDGRARARRSNTLLRSRRRLTASAATPASSFCTQHEKSFAPPWPALLTSARYVLRGEAFSSAPPAALVRAGAPHAVRVREIHNFREPT
jgi:hypothetical protein